MLLKHSWRSGAVDKLHWHTILKEITATNPMRSNHIIKGQHDLFQYSTREIVLHVGLSFCWLIARTYRTIVLGLLPSSKDVDPLMQSNGNGLCIRPTFCYVLFWFESVRVYPYLPGLLHCHQGNRTIAEICSQGSNLQQARVVSDNGLAPNGRQPIIWISDGLGYWCIYASLGLDGWNFQWICDAIV